jgi:DNA-binding transcriptional LysR family regulator
MMFQDDLLVRSPQGFELTLRGRKILQEIEGLLPKMENLVTPSLFDPMREKPYRGEMFRSARQAKVSGLSRME